VLDDLTLDVGLIVDRTSVSENAILRNLFQWGPHEWHKITLFEFIFLTLLSLTWSDCSKLSLSSHHLLCIELGSCRNGASFLIGSIDSASFSEWDWPIIHEQTNVFFVWLDGRTLVNQVLKSMVALDTFLRLATRGKHKNWAWLLDGGWSHLILKNILMVRKLYCFLVSNETFCSRLEITLRI
jgi:hypothetical protein